MKAENGCGGETRQGYCSFPPYLLTKKASDLMRGEDLWGCKILVMMSFCSAAVEMKMCLSSSSRKSIYITPKETGVLQCLSDQRLQFSFLKRTCLCVWTLVSSQCVSVSQWWAPPAGKSFRKPSVHFHSSFQQCECCDSLLGAKGLLRSGLPQLYASGPASTGRPSQFLLEPPGALQSSPPGAQRAKRHQGTL